MMIRWVVGAVYWRFDTETQTDEILTVQSPKFTDPTGNMYDTIPGGRVELRDIRFGLKGTLEATLRRETREEIGEVRIQDIHYMGRKIRIQKRNNTPTLFIYEDYLVSVSGEIVLDDQELKAYRWDSLEDKVDLNLHPPTEELFTKVRAQGMIPIRRNSCGIY